MIYQDQEFLQYVVNELVEHPDAVKITRKIDPTGILLELEVHPDDMGRIIGRSGRTADAIRKLLWVIGTKNETRISFKIIEPENSEFNGNPYNEPSIKADKVAVSDASTDPANLEINPDPEPVATSPDEASEI